MYVIMLHSVGNEKSSWHRWWLSASLTQFETFCRYLVANKYTTHFLDEWYEYFSVNQHRDSKKLVLTFDDGYLDNWVYVMPILRKYGLKGTAFVNPEFIDFEGVLRPTIEEVWDGKIDQKELRTLGFLNWNEVKAMQESGIIDIQSHSMSHNRYFKSSKVVGIYNGEPKLDWLSWFINPKCKPYSIMGIQPPNISSGYPIFESDRALRIRRYFPDDRLIELSVNYYNKNQSINTGLLQKIQQLTNKYPGHFETDEEMEDRYRYELFESKTILQMKLGKPIDFLCWPGGGYNSLSLKLSKEAGYKASTISSVDESYFKLNERIRRFGLNSVISKKDKYIKVTSPNFFVDILKAQTVNYPLRIWLKFTKEMIKIVKG